MKDWAQSGPALLLAATADGDDGADDDDNDGHDDDVMMMILMMMTTIMMLLIVMLLTNSKLEPSVRSSGTVLARRVCLSILSTVPPVDAPKYIYCTYIVASFLYPSHITILYRSSAVDAQ